MLRQFRLKYSSYAANQVQQIKISDIPITLTQKRIKTIRLAVYPSKEVKVSAPLRMSFDDIAKFINSKIDWIRKSREKFSGCNYHKPVRHKFISGEKHYFFGQEYLLQVVEVKGVNSVMLDDDVMVLNVKKGSTIQIRRKVVEDYYRKKLKEIIPQYIAQYEPKMGVKVLEFGVKKMKTRWGTCNPRAQRIWLGLELAKRPMECLEYIVVHEMVHLLEIRHNKRFFAFMDEFMVDWKKWQGVLKGV
jgi:predicted metal-dependent hydrolase